MAVNYFYYLLPDHERFIAGKANIHRKKRRAQGHDGGSTLYLLKFVVINYEIAPPLADCSAHFQHVYGCICSLAGCVNSNSYHKGMICHELICSQQ
jgi:hypothetical protein